ncbi:MAG: MerR family transcriptional regulator [Chloroflexi bacterium]|nr:MerR family transcriptional regulator [Chloroflexota bacterium]
MLKIGEFSRLSQVPVKTLRYYDEIDLFKPSQIDPFTDYRYYTLDQLPRIHSIMALKELGLSLEEIALLLQADLPPEQIRGMYRLKHAEVEQRIREEQTRLAKIEFRLRQIEMEGQMRSVDIVIKRIEPFYALTMRRKFLNRQEREFVGHAIEKADYAGKIQWDQASPIEILYEDEFHGEYTDSEITIPVDSTHTPTVSLGEAGTFILREIPAIETAATYIHQGDYPSLNEKYLFLQRWAVENGYKLSGTWRFVYHRGPMHHVDPFDYLTELQHPIEQA